MDKTITLIGNQRSFDKLLPSRFIEDGEASPRGADTLCSTCLEHGACREWVLESAEEIYADHPSWNKEAVIEFMAVNVLSGDYNHNTSIDQLTKEYKEA